MKNKLLEIQFKKMITAYAICEIILLAILFLCPQEILAVNTYSYSFESGGADSRADETITQWNLGSYDYKATRNINKLKFTQNDTYYFIDYDIDYVCNNISYDSSKGIGTVVFVDSTYSKYNTEYKETINSGSLILSNLDIKNISFNIWEGIYGRSGYGAEWTYNYSVNGLATAKMHENCKRTYDGDIREYGFNSTLDFYAVNMPTVTIPLRTLYLGYYKQYAYSNKNVLSGIKSNGASVTQNVTYIGDGKWGYNYKGRVSILKTMASNYKYLSLLAPCAKITSYSGNTHWCNYDYYNCSFVGLYGDSIDISSYLNCNHEWVLSNTGDKINHKVKCSKCDWEKDEAHNLSYEYDGIQYNVCTCSYIDKVNYEFIINDDAIGEKKEVYDSYSDYTKYRFTHKTGYNFKWYEKYEKRYDNEATPSLLVSSTPIKDILVGTCSDLTEKTGLYSTKYKAIYSPIHYTFRYSTFSNVYIDKAIDDQVFAYDEMKSLQDNIHIKGLAFKGWSLATNSDAIAFKGNEKVINYTDVDNKVITIYPQYDVLKFSLTYVTSLGQFSNGKNTLTIYYSYDDDSKIEEGIYNLPSEMYLNYWSYDGKKFYSMSEIKEYIDSLNMYDPNIKLVANFASPNYGRIERTKKDIVPNSNDIAESSEDTIETNRTGIDLYRLFKDTSDKIIDGFTDSQKKFSVTYKDKYKDNKSFSSNAEKSYNGISLLSKKIIDFIFSAFGMVFSLTFLWFSVYLFLLVIIKKKRKK